MGITRGPNNVNKDLYFGYDTGYGVSDKNTGTRFCPGESTTNVTPLTDFFDLSNWTGGGWSGGAAYSTDYDNVLEFTVTNGWRTFAINHGITSGGTVSVSFEYRLKSRQTTGIYGLVLNGLNLGNYHNDLGSISAADMLASKGGWKTYNGSFPANNNTYGAKLCIGLRGADNGGLTDVFCIRRLQVEQKAHQTPYVDTSRSDTASLIDLKRTTSIDVGDVSFDTNAQLDYDGSSDYIGFNNASSPITNVSYELIIKFDSIPATNSYCSVFQKSSNWNNAGGIMMHFIYGHWRWCYGNSWGGAVSYPQSNFTTGKYYHIVGTVDNISGANAKLYVNGVQVGSTGTGSKPNTTSNLEVGRGNGGNHNGKIDVFKTYENTLTAEDVKQNYKVYKNRFNL